MVLCRIDADDLPALAVGDLGRVDPGDDPVADGEVLAADGQGLRPQAALRREQLAGAFVQLGDVAGAAGDHHRVLAGGEALVPVEHQGVERLGQGVGDHQAVVGAQQVERVRAAAFVGEFDDPAVDRIALAADLRQHHRLDLVGQVAVEAAGTDRADLAGVADQRRACRRSPRRGRPARSMCGRRAWCEDSSTTITVPRGSGAMPRSASLAGLDQQAR